MAGYSCKAFVFTNLSFQALQSFFPCGTEHESIESAVGAHHSMTRNQDRQRVTSQRVTHRARRPRPPQTARQPLIAPGFTVRNLGREIQYRSAERRQRAKVATRRERAQTTGEVGA